ncbi:hypothetical protein HELRODRAFT_159200 [Helobdella robusta]|uniref:Peptidase M12B domain-containing protein n=1 Tax=Helobdella robusta TaxID=6412 RepID=T1ENQ6_HELRO|nr:hypothetical protein HELRODRAFT_159200 [Helobdella robusta]ESO12628.1 hypothetical protein HELRODRAFT_159200 [Helobdella robusta]
MQNGEHVQQLTIDLTTASNENFILDLHMNTQLFSSNYEERVVDASNIRYNSFAQVKSVDGVNKTLKQLYQALGSSNNAAFNRIKSVVNAANALYNSVGIYLILVGSDIWTSQQITVDPDISKTLDNWYIYKANSLNGRVASHDHAALISAQVFTSNIVGKAMLGKMCDSINSGIVIEVADRGTTGAAYPAAILTHEMGHSFGLTHDDSCACSDAACIMKTSINPSSPPTKFSSCSLNEFANNWIKGYDLCLWNIPDIVASSTCGNGVVEDGETCDCGGLPSDVCNPSCCNKVTCQLVSTYQCASGLCCDLPTCKFYQANTVCRGASGTCDIQELCGGTSAYCPEDTYKHDGTQCAVDGVTAYCSEGKCRTRDTQCAFVWGSGIKSSPESCYTNNNMKGMFSGSCRQTLTLNPTYYPCAAGDVLCGQLFCDTSKFSNTQLRSNSNGYVSFGTTLTCIFAIFNFGTQIPNPGYVPNGASCGNNKMCYNNACTPVSDILSITSCASSCSSTGVCNNKGTCQCSNGLTYPQCSGNIITIVPPSGTTTTTTTTTQAPKLNRSCVINYSIPLLIILLIMLFGLAI